MGQIELVGLREALETLDPNIVRRAGRRSINIVVKSGRTEASSQIRQVWNIRKGELDPRIEIVQASLNSMGAYITFSGKGISTAYFDAVQFTGSTVRRLKKTKGKVEEKKVTRQKPYKFQGVRTTVKVGRPKALPGSFLAKMKNGHLGVMHRVSGKMMKGKKKQAIEQKGVVSVATMFENPKVLAAFLNRLHVQWATVFPHELEYERSRKNGKAV